MSERVSVLELAPLHYAVTVLEGETTTNHKVAVSAEFLDDTELGDFDVAEVVYESFEFLLDREPANEIPGDFPLEQIPRTFPDFYDELRRRLGRA